MMSRAFERSGSLHEPFLTVLPVTGAAVSVLNADIGQSTVSASDSTAAWLDELQLDLGEGPCWDALTTRAPILRSEVGEATRSDWPLFSAAVQDNSEVSAIFAFPLALGSLEIGAVDLYATTRMELTGSQVSQASELATLATWQVVRGILAVNSDELDISPASRREVHQATGMILVQLDIGVDEAMLLLRAHAFSSGRTVHEVAVDVVDRVIDFTTMDGITP